MPTLPWHIHVSHISQKKHNSLQTYSSRIYPSLQTYSSRIYPSLAALIPQLDNDFIFIWRSFLYAVSSPWSPTMKTCTHTQTHTHPIYPVGLRGRAFLTTNPCRIWPQLCKSRTAGLLNSYSPASNLFDTQWWASPSEENQSMLPPGPSPPEKAERETPAPHRAQ